MKKPFNRSIRILIASHAMVLVAAGMLVPIYALFVEKIGGDLLDASLAFGVFTLVAGITTLISGRYSDELKETELILATGYVVTGIGFFSYILVDSIFSLLVVQVIIGIGQAIYWPSFDTIYSQHLDKGKVGREWGAFEGMTYFVAAIGATVGGLVVTKFGFNTMFTLMGLLTLGSAIYIFLLPRKIL